MYKIEEFKVITAKGLRNLNDINESEDYLHNHNGEAIFKNIRSNTNHIFGCFNQLKNLLNFENKTYNLILDSKKLFKLDESLVNYTSTRKDVLSRSISDKRENGIRLLDTLFSNLISKLFVKSYENVYELRITCSELQDKALNFIDDFLSNLDLSSNYKLKINKESKWLEAIFTVTRFYETKESIFHISKPYINKVMEFYNVLKYNSDTNKIFKDEKYNNIKSEIAALACIGGYDFLNNTYTKPEANLKYVDVNENQLVLVRNQDTLVLSY